MSRGLSLNEPYYSQRYRLAVAYFRITRKGMTSRKTIKISL